MTEEDIPDIVETLRACAKESRAVEGDYYADQFATDASVFEDAADAIERLRSERNQWMERSLAHALEADRYRVETINLKGQLFQKEREHAD